MQQKEELAAFLSGFVAKNLADVLLVAGCAGNIQDIVEMILEMFGERINVITTAALDLNRVLGEEITSCDLETVCEPDRIDFDPLTMEDIGDGHSARRGVSQTLCTTEMGLKRVVKEMEDGEIWWDDRILLKPKVALETLADGLARLKMVK